MSQMMPFKPTAKTTEPQRLVSPGHPFAFGLAVRDVPKRGIEIMPGEITTVEVADGTSRAHEPKDWFGTRVPIIPPVTGPLRVAGLRSGEDLAIEVLGLAPNDSIVGSPILVTLAISGGAGMCTQKVQAAIPSGGVARIPALREGGLLSVGPVLIKQDLGGIQTWKTIAARVTVRCAVARPSRG